jgi:hypothetical protein
VSGLPNTLKFTLTVNPTSPGSQTACVEILDGAGLVKQKKKKKEDM